MRWRIWRQGGRSRDNLPAATPDARIARVEEAIARLPDLPREVFIMHRFEDLSYERIARRLDIDVKEVETCIAATLVAVCYALEEWVMAAFAAALRSSETGLKINIWLTIVADDEVIAVPMPSRLLTLTIGGIAKGGAT